MLENHENREKIFSEKWNDREQLHKTHLMELQKIHEDHMRLCRDEFKAVSNKGIAEAFEVVKPEKINALVEDLGKATFIDVFKQGS